MEKTSVYQHSGDYAQKHNKLEQYPFQDQLLIYAQRPNATACASY